MTSRTSKIERTTQETKIEATLNLDGTGRSEISTGIGFLDHLLTSLARHSGGLHLEQLGDGGQVFFGYYAGHIAGDLQYITTISELPRKAFPTLKKLATWTTGWQRCEPDNRLGPFGRASAGLGTTHIRPDRPRTHRIDFDVIIPHRSCHQSS